MKIRRDFVTNSSSTSFIAVMNNNPDYLEKVNEIKNTYFKEDESIGLLKEGNCCFGWDCVKYNDFPSKLNFAILQTALTHDVELSQVLSDVIDNDFDVTIDWFTVYRMISDLDAYIDHQSLIDEDYTIKELIFEDTNMLRKFLYDPNSCVITGNDNRYGSYNDDLDIPYKKDSNYITT